MPQNSAPDRLLSDGSYVNYSNQNQRAVQTLNEEPLDMHITAYTDTTDDWHYSIKEDGHAIGRVNLTDNRL